MHSNCILASVANLLVRHMVFVENVQKSPIAAHLKDLDPSLYFCCQDPALTGFLRHNLSACPQDVMESAYGASSPGVRSSVWDPSSILLQEELEKGS